MSGSFFSSVLQVLAEHHNQLLVDSKARGAFEVWQKEEFNRINRRVYDEYQQVQLEYRGIRDGVQREYRAVSDGVQKEYRAIKASLNSVLCWIMVEVAWIFYLAYAALTVILVIMINHHLDSTYFRLTDPKHTGILLSFREVASLGLLFIWEFLVSDSVLADQNFLMISDVVIDSIFSIHFSSPYFLLMFVRDVFGRYCPWFIRSIFNILAFLSIFGVYHSFVFSATLGHFFGALHNPSLSFFPNNQFFTWVWEGNSVNIVGVVVAGAFAAGFVAVAIGVVVGSSTAAAAGTASSNNPLYSAPMKARFNACTLKRKE